MYFAHFHRFLGQSEIVRILSSHSVTVLMDHFDCSAARWIECDLDAFVRPPTEKSTQVERQTRREKVRKIFTKKQFVLSIFKWENDASERRWLSRNKSRRLAIFAVKSRMKCTSYSRRILWSFFFSLWCLCCASHSTVILHSALGCEAYTMHLRRSNSTAVKSRPTDSRAAQEEGRLISMGTNIAPHRHSP